MRMRSGFSPPMCSRPSEKPASKDEGGRRLVARKAQAKEKAAQGALALLMMFTPAGCTVTIVDIDAGTKCQKEMTVEVLGGRVLHTCEEIFDPDGALTP